MNCSNTTAMLPIELEAVQGQALVEGIEIVGYDLVDATTELYIKTRKITGRTLLQTELIIDGSDIEFDLDGQETEDLPTGMLYWQIWASKGVEPTIEKTLLAFGTLKVTNRYV